MCIATVQQYFTLIVKSFGFGTFETNLLTIPYNVSPTDSCEATCRTNSCEGYIHHHPIELDILFRSFQIAYLGLAVPANLGPATLHLYQCG